MLSSPSRRRLIPACAVSISLLASELTSEARADEPAPAPSTDSPAAPAPPASTAGTDEVALELRSLSHTIELDKHILGSVELGQGFRFNNPYRLATQLSADPRSVSITAAYADVAAGFTIGPPDGLQHGGAVHTSFAIEGVPQAVITPTYLLAYRGPRAVLGYGRLGPSFVLTPDPTIGLEAAGGFAWFFTSKFAIAGEVVFDVYYGAGTHDVAIATYPIVSGQLGLLFDQELLP
jgi:hypothetical protein